jgi:mono/diheme cytochrome c family protein
MSALLLSSCSERSGATLQPGTIPPPADVANVTYQTNIRPIFENACFQCHGAEKKKGGLRLDSRDHAIKGGDNGPVFEVGRSAGSFLITNVARVGDPENWMPPIDKGEPLTLAQIALIRAWIDQGAN